MLDEVRRSLRLNPHMIRFSVVKTGDKLGGHANQSMKIEEQTGENEWNNEAAGIGMTMKSGDHFFK